MTGVPRGRPGAPTRRAVVLAALAIGLFSLPYVQAGATASPATPVAEPHAGSTSVAATEIAAARASIAAGHGPAAVSVNGTWTDALPTLTSLPEFVYDGADGYLVVFQGLVSQSWNSTWIYVHGNWTQLNESAAPTNRFGASIAYDPADQEVVLFGGFDAGPNNFPYNDTWTFRGGIWTRLAASQTGAPSPRGFASMAYDAASSSLILFGGETNWYCSKNCGLSILQDTWSFSKGVWHKVPTGAPVPPRRAGQGMAYDPSSGNLTMFGGFYPTYSLYSNASHPHPIREWTTSPRNDTWSFRAGKWRQVVGPGPGAGSNSLFYSPLYNGKGSISFSYIPGMNGSVLFGNASEGTWRFANDTWTRLAAAPPPPDGEPITFDSALGEAVQFGAIVSVFDGTNWTTPVNPLSLRPGQPMLTYDSGDGYVLGYVASSSRTWVFENGSWSDITASTGSSQPPPRSGATFTYDAADNETILFGGVKCNYVNGGEVCVPLNDTWALRNGHWTNLHLSHSPPRPIYGASAAYDSQSKEIVLFGGRAWARPITCFCVGPYLNETWAFSAGRWTELNSTVSTPSARDNFNLVNDPNAGGVLLFGGEGPSGTDNDTWLFSGGNWTRLSTTDA